ncbi:hypothetical protein A0H81_04509 [Grifola frondosa]|uniref:Uncharacterized protein n=1 Tax=Grifola frondosa TaxID=5627 RepID=A0A1C7MEC6_GRIFR|nr:hypothetical protein A0H81_04509 [Grifola frondosa]
MPSGPLNTQAGLKGLIRKPAAYIKRVSFDKESDGPSLQQALGMEDDADKFQKMIGLMRRVGDKYFDWKTPYLSQKKETKELYKEEVLAMCPDLTSYEAGWPVDHYMRIAMNGRCRRFGNHRSYRSRVKNKEARHNLHDGPTLHKKARSRAGPGRPGPGRDSLGIVNRPATRTPTQSASAMVSMHGPYKTDIGTTTSTHCSQKASEELDALQPMLTLLSTLQVPLNDALRIARTFKSIGIKNVAWMHIFAHMPQRNDLLMKIFKRVNYRR